VRHEAATLFLYALAILALVPGYLLWLRLARRVTKHRPPSERRPATPPARIDVLVPVHDEAAWIEEKLRNLATLEEPAGGLVFWIVDGGSGDGTSEIAASWSARDGRFQLLRDVSGGKVAALNAALARCEGEWTLVTDADARLPSSVVLEMLGVAARDPELAVIGVPVEASQAHALDRMHWRALNAARRAEAHLGSAAIVTAPCYLFRRELLPLGFPDRVVADDVHIAMVAAAAGKRVGFADRTVVELRSPIRLGQLFRHKVRKADAYLREVLRFLPRIASFPPPARAVFLWRAAQMICFPLAALGATVEFTQWSATLGAETAAALAAAATAVFGGDIALAIRRSREPRLTIAVVLGGLLAAVLLTTLITAPLARRTARYPKVSSGPLGAWREGTGA